jgi:hypothetical protein
MSKDTSPDQQNASLFDGLMTCHLKVLLKFPVIYNACLHYGFTTNVGKWEIICTQCTHTHV